MAKIIVPGKTPAECQKEIDRKIAGGWQPTTGIIEDKAWIGGRWVCIMERPDIPGKKRRWNDI